MTVSKRKKVVKYRGSKTHGGGSMKKRRGAGNRGGRGMAGSGKRAKQKKPTILKLYGREYFGKHGFKRPQKVFVRQKGVNIASLEERFDALLAKGIFKKEGEFYSINLKSIGCNKLLGAGNATRKYSISCRFASASAIEKVKKAGGKVSCAAAEGGK